MKAPLAFLMGLTSMAAIEAQAQTITLLYNERPPYLIGADGQVKGITGEATEKAFRKAGIQFLWQETPATRQLDTVKQNESEVCTPGWFKNPDRESFARFTKPIYQDKPNALLGRADDKRLSAYPNVDALLSDQNLRLLVKKSYSYGSVLDKKLSEFQPQKSETGSENVVMAKQIASDRADYMFVSAEEGAYMLGSDELKNEKLSLYPIAGMPEGSNRYILCSMKVPEAIIARLNAAIE